MSENKPDFVKKEEAVLAFWQQSKIFEKSVEMRPAKRSYIFYDGPPFATGTPHYGHLPASFIKDVVPRFWTMRGHRVERRWGWDCHGLPIENIVEQELNLKTKKDIEKLGIKKFNQTARELVLRYADEWQKVIPRLGRWVDMENSYKTMDLEYMDSVWWVFKQLWDKGLVFQEHRSMHICPRCETTLSNFEVTQGYKDITDLAVTVKFKLKDFEHDGQPVYALAWTTTAWTLPGNTALAVGENVNYVKFKRYDSEKDKEEVYIASEEFYQQLQDEPHGEMAFLNTEKTIKNVQYGKCEKITTLKGKELLGKRYEPLFDFYSSTDITGKEKGWKVYSADFVTTDEGTGIVHIAPAFGEDDAALGKKHGLPFIQHVNMHGQFAEAVKPWAGLAVKPKGNPKATDQKIAEELKKQSRLFDVQELKHSYPHCWRCETPLLNYSAKTWFVNVTKIKDKLLKNNQKIRWVPAHLRDGRFGKWLKNAKDWNVARTRFWGATIPVWETKTGEQICIGSKEELEKLSGQKVNDLHKDIVDDITFEYKGQTAKRIPEVFDCWFESGSMPYAQNATQDKTKLPAEFISEGLDQTRGWFYTLHVLGTALFNKPAFANNVVHGIVLAEDGQKMSKRLKNYPEIEGVVNQYGADAIRYYILTSPVMTAADLNFSVKGVDEMVKKIILLTYNIHSFYAMYADGKVATPAPKANHVLDKWILAKLHELIAAVTTAMENYELMKASRPIQEFINELSTWWLRRSRARCKNETTRTDAIDTLGYVLLELTKVMAPFTPFIAEKIYQDIKGPKESVHLEDWPRADTKLIDKKMLEEMNLARQIVEAGLAARDEAKIKVRQPLQSYATDLAKTLGPELVEIVTAELNVKELKFGAPKLDTALTDELKLEGQLRDLVRHINSLRKAQGLTPQDSIAIYYQGGSAVIEKMSDQIKATTLAQEIKAEKIAKMQAIKIGNEKLSLGIKKV